MATEIEIQEFMLECLKVFEPDESVFDTKIDKMVEKSTYTSISLYVNAIFKRFNWKIPPSMGAAHDTDNSKKESLGEEV